MESETTSQVWVFKYAPNKFNTLDFLRQIDFICFNYGIKSVCSVAMILHMVIRELRKEHMGFLQPVEMRV